MNLQEATRRALRAMAPASGSIIGVSTDAPVIALTFDDGPDPDVTPHIVDLLARHDARATFFMVGREAQAHPDVVRQVVAAGHTVANHTWDHRSLVLDAPPAPLAASRWRRAEIRQGARAIGPQAARMVRPPFGHQDWWVRFDSMVTRTKVIGWTVGAGDWLDDSPRYMADRVLEVVHGGDIVLFHDGLVDAERRVPFDRERSLDAVGLVLDALDRYRFVTVPELLRLGPPRYRYRYPRATRTGGPLGDDPLATPQRTLPVGE